MLKFKNLKISIIAVILTLALLLSACGKSEKAKVNSSQTNSTISQNQTGNNTVTNGDTIKPENNNNVTLEDVQADHVDKDGNGKCDKCNESVLVYIDFFSINDLHGKVCDSSSQPGVDELTTYFKKMYQTEDNVVILSSGDMWQGSSESNLTNGKLTTEWMNYIGVESMAVGNHEYDWGGDAIKENSQIADFKILAINIYSKNNNKQVEYCQSSVMIERNGIKIGIIGAVGDNFSSISSDMTKDIYFKTGKELTALVKAESEKLRSQGAQIIIYSLHDGYNKSTNGYIDDSKLSSFYDISLSSGGYVDVVFEAHTHQNYVLKDSYGVYHMQGGGENKGISHLEIAFNVVNLDYRVSDAKFISNSVYQSLSSDPIIDNLLKKYEKELEKANSVLGYNPSTKNSEYIEALVAQLYYEKGIEKWGDKYDIVLGGGFLRLRSPYYLYAGEVLYSNLLSILPFDNELVLCSIKGKDLKSKFFETTNSDYHIYYGSYGAEVKNNIQSNKTYYVIVDSYTSTYKYNNLTEIERLGTDIYARDLLAQYILDGRLK